MTRRPIYLVSITPTTRNDIIHLPLLTTKWLQPKLLFSSFDGIILTSKNGIEALERIDPEWKRLPVVCVGKATQRKAAELGANVVATADGYGEGVFELIREHYGDKRWLYARPKVVASDFTQQLRDAGVDVKEAIVYETVCKAEAIQMHVDDNSVLIFTSPSAAACFQRRFHIQRSHTVVAIGNTTAQRLQAHTVHVASEPTVASCIALAETLAQEKA